MVQKGGNSVIRIDKPDGSIDIHEHDPCEWIGHQEDDDLAIIPFLALDGVHQVKSVPPSMLLTRNIMKRHDFGPGDDVFMVGRFVRHDRKRTNAPSARFGKLSMMP